LTPNKKVIVVDRGPDWGKAVQRLEIWHGRQVTLQGSRRLRKARRFSSVLFLLSIVLKWKEMTVGLVGVHPGVDVNCITWKERDINDSITLTNGVQEEDLAGNHVY
jgi:hypothetical protein